jgi:MSHA biogenesis protein MshG
LANFNYSGRDSSGALVSGAVEASTADEVASLLFGDSITPIEIRQAAKKQTKRRSEKKSKSMAKLDPNASAIDKANAWLAGTKIEIDELIIFSRQMYSLTKAGLPLDRAIKGLEASMTNLHFRGVLQDVVNGLENGLNLSSAMSQHPKVFSNLFLSLVHVGENTGQLDLAFREIGKYLALEKSTRQQVKSAVRYPIFVMVAMVAALLVVTLFVIPVFSSVFDRLGADLPWQTVVLIESSAFIVNYWPYILFAVTGAVMAFRTWTKTEAGELKWDEKKLHLPLAGKVLEKVALGRFARTFSMVMRAGVPIVQGLNVVAGAVDNAYIAKNIYAMREGIERGEPLFRTAVNTNMFSPIVLQMISVGEDTGTVDELLQEVADFYDVEVEYDIKQLSDAIEPILITFIAGLVLILALGVFLPIWDLNTAVNGG